MSRSISIILFTFIFLTGNVFAAQMASMKLNFTQRDISVVDDKNDIDALYHTIGSATITLVEETVVDGDKADFFSSVGDVTMMINKLIAVGKKIWEIVDAGRPVVEANLNPISVLPRTENPDYAFTNMYGWSLPVVRRYRVNYTNLLGMNVIDFEFTVIFQYDGKYEGHGRYLTGVNVVADNIAVSWGFNFNVSSKLMAISNRGTMEEPIAAATIQLDYIGKSSGKEIRSSIIFHIDGAGNIIKL